MQDYYYTIILRRFTHGFNRSRKNHNSNLAPYILIHPRGFDGLMAFLAEEGATDVPRAERERPPVAAAEQRERRCAE